LNEYENSLVCTRDVTSWKRVAVAGHRFISSPAAPIISQSSCQC